MLKNVQGFARANSLRTAPVIQLIATGAMALVIGSVGHYVDLSRSVASIPQAVATAAAPMENTLHQVVASAPAQAMIKAASPQTENYTRAVELDDGQTFAELLADAGVPDVDAMAAMNALSKAYDLRQLRAGQAINLDFSRSPRSDILIGANFTPEATREITISRDAAGSFIANQKIIPIIRQRLAANGEIRSTLYDAGDRVGVPHAVMAALMHIYAHDIDFQRDIHPGDRFQVMYDQPMTAQGKAVGEGAIIYASLQIAGKDRPIYRVTFNDNTTDYFDPSGHSIRRAILRTPVAAARITSGFGMRVHPLLGYSKMHKGVDFGAPTGTPIFAAGNGVIEEIGPKNGYGRFILIRHNNQMETAYAHMSRFNTALYRGAHVNQGQVIGYVGMSGRATGPHLHFEVRIAGKQVNPMGVNMPTGRVLDGTLLTMFRQGKTRIDAEFIKTLSAKAMTPGTAHTDPSLIPAAASGPAYTPAQTTACGSKGGC